MNKPLSVLILVMLVGLTSDAQNVVSGRRNEIFYRSNLVSANVLQSPWEVTWGPDDSLWVTESSPKTGYLVRKIHPVGGANRIILDLKTFVDPASSPTNKWQKKFTPDAFLPAPNSTWKIPSYQGGLMGLAIHPEFMTNPAKKFVYLAYGHDYITPQSKPDADPKVITVHNGQTVFGHLFQTWVVRFEYVNGLLVNPIALCDTIPGSNDHNSGRLMIRTEGGQPFLYYAVGDVGAGQFDNLKRWNKSQHLNSYEGKILRFNLEPDTDPAQGAVNYNQWIPNSNPFNGTQQSAVWATGIRNNQGFAFARINGVERMYGSSHGPFSDDEINLLESARNYGHPVIIGKADGNYDGAKAGPSNSNLPLIVNEVEMADTLTNYKDPIFTNYIAPKGNASTFWSVQHIYINNNYASASYPQFNCGNATCSPQNANGFWYSEGYSGLDIYTSSLIPGWKNSLMVTALKWARVVRMKLNEAGTAVVPTAGGDTISLFQTRNRYRDMAISPDGKNIYVVLETGSSSSGPSFNNPQIPDCAGCLQRYEFLGYADAAGVSTIPNNIPVAQGSGGLCENANTITVSFNSNNGTTWIPITDTNSNILAEIRPNDRLLNANISAAVYKNTATVRQDGARRLYLDRNITITSSIPTTTSGNVNLRIYITHAEYEALRTAVNSTGQPSGVTNINDLKLFRSRDNCRSAILNPASLVSDATVAAFGPNAYVISAAIPITTGGTSLTSTFYIGGPGTTTLPTSMLSFTGNLNTNKVDLFWTTASEINARSFEIERSLDGVNFETIGSKDAMGGVGQNADYSFTDFNILHQPSIVLYYRLKMLDQDGQFTYSSNVLVSLASVAGKLSVTPNPVAEIASVSATAVQDGRATWKLVDNSGRIVQTGSVDLRKGNNYFPLNLKKLGAGIYILQISGKGIDQQTKVQKL